MATLKLRVSTPLLFTLSAISGFSQAAPVPIETATLDIQPETAHSLGIGFTSSVAERPFVGVGNQKASLPYVMYHYKNFYIEGLNIGYTVRTNNNYSLELYGTPRFYEINAESAPNGELDGIDATKPTYFAGVATRFRYDIAVLAVQLLTDLKESNGSELVITASKAITLTQNITLSPTIGLTVQDARLVDHFYGVQAHEVRPGRPAYRGQASLNYNAAITASWNATRHVQLLGQLKYEQLGSGITDSPIVNEDGIATVALGAVYHF
jgi:MipA family protein